MTRRSATDGSIYRRASDGKWCASIDLRAGGKRRRKVLYGKTRAEVARKLAKAKAEHAQSGLALDSPTVEQWLRSWRDEIAAERIRPSTMRSYNTYIEQHIVPRIGKHRVDRLEPQHVRRLYADMRRACPDPDLAGKCPHRPSHGRAEASVRQCHAILRRALKVAVREGKATRNVADLVDPPDTIKNPRTPLTVHQARLVLKAADGDDMESRWYAALWLGLRQGEALGLAWADVDLEAGAIHVSRALQRVKGRGLVFVAPKSRTSLRRVSVPPTVLSRLVVHWAREAAKGATPDWLVWGGPKPTDPAKDYKAWGALLRKADVPHVALHAARNTTGSLLMAAGVPDKVTAEILGHSSVQVTQGHYLHGDAEQHDRAMLELEQYAG